MTRISRPAILLACAFALVIALAPAPVSACPPCANHEMWNPNCALGGCSYCAFCSYCCGRYGIGCQYCDIVADSVTTSAPGACDDASTPLSVDQFDRLFGTGTSDTTAQVLASVE